MALKSAYADCIISETNTVFYIRILHQSYYLVHKEYH